jgi:hypothetical protein
VADEPTPTSSDAFDLVLDKATDKFAVWQQLPAWVLGAAANAGGGFLIAFPKHLSNAQTRDAWAAVIIALVLAVLLSYRSAFTLSKGTPPPSTANAPQQQKQ